MVAGEPFDGAGIAAAGGVAQLLGLAAQLVEVGALGKRSGHGVSLLRLRSAAQAEEEATAMTVGASEVDSVLPADPAAPSGADTMLVRAPGASHRRTVSRPRRSQQVSSETVRFL